MSDYDGASGDIMTIEECAEEIGRLVDRIKALESAVDKVVEIEKRVRQGAPKYRTTEPELGRAIDALSALLGVQT